MHNKGKVVGAYRKNDGGQNKEDNIMERIRSQEGNVEDHDSFI